MYSNVFHFQRDLERVSSHNGGRIALMTIDGSSKGTILSTHISRLKQQKIQKSNRKRHDSIIELDDGKIETGTPNQFDCKNHGFRWKFSLNQSTDLIHSFFLHVVLYPGRSPGYVLGASAQYPTYWDWPPSGSISSGENDVGLRIVLLTIYHSYSCNT